MKAIARKGAFFYIFIGLFFIYWKGAFASGEGVRRLSAVPMLPSRGGFFSFFMRGGFFSIFMRGGFFLFL